MPEICSKHDNTHLKFIAKLSSQSTKRVVPVFVDRDAGEERNTRETVGGCLDINEWVNGRLGQAFIMYVSRIGTLHAANNTQ